MASVPWVFECDKEDGFIMDPNQHKSVGYIVSLGGLGIQSTFPQDLTVNIPYSSTKPPGYPGLKLKSTTPTSMNVVGVIDKFEWEGGVGSPLKFDFYVSQTNATQLKALQQTTLQSTAVKSLSWWICSFDQEAKQWYEASFPKTGLITGLIQNKDNPELNIDLQGVPVKDGIDVMVYKVSIAVAPAANMSYALSFSNSATMHQVKSWGLVVGGLSAQAPT